MIEVEISGRVGNFVLGVAFHCPMHGISALFGSSGSGKTTILRAIAGLQRLEGRVIIGNVVWQDDSRQIFLPSHQRSIGYVFQEASLFPHLSVRRNLEFGFRRVQQQRVRFDDAVDLLGIAELLDRHPEQLSGGQRQRVGIARALLTSPQLLLMDEPLASLDQVSKREILPYLERLHKELRMPVLYVSHAPKEIARLADHLVIVDNGKIRCAGTLNELYSRLDLAMDRGNDADTIIQAQVHAHDDEYHLSYLDFPGGRFSIERLSIASGQLGRLRVLANDVSITLQAQTHTSILNIFPATITAMQADGEAKILLQLDLSGTPLLARITRKSAHNLDLKSGKQVFAQIKSVALID